MTVIKKCFKKIMQLFLTNPLFIYETLSEIKKKEKISHQFTFFLNQVPFLIGLAQEEKKIICQKKNLLILRDNIYHQHLKPNKKINFYQGMILINEFNQQLNLDPILTKTIIQKLEKRSFLEVITKERSIRFNMQKIEANIDSFKNTLSEAFPKIKKEHQIKISQKIIEIYRKTTELFPSSIARIFYEKIKKNPNFSKGFLQEKEFLFKEKKPFFPEDLENVYIEAYTILNHHKFTEKKNITTNDRKYYTDYANFLTDVTIDWFLKNPLIENSTNEVQMNQLINKRIKTKILSYLSFIPGDSLKKITSFYHNQERLNYDHNRKIVQKLYF